MAKFLLIIENDGDNDNGLLIGMDEAGKKEIKETSNILGDIFGGIVDPNLFPDIRGVFIVEANVSPEGITDGEIMWTDISYTKVDIPGF